MPKIQVLLFFLVKTEHVLEILNQNMQIQSFSYNHFNNCANSKGN